MTAKRIPRRRKPDTTCNACQLEDIIKYQHHREKSMVPVRVNRTTVVLVSKEKRLQLNQ